MEKKKNGLWLYVLLTFALTWTHMFAVVYPAAGGSTQVYQLLVMGCMFFPTACMLLTRLLKREGFTDLLIRPRLKGNGKYYLIAYLGLPAMVLLGAALYYILFPDKLDWSAPILRQQMAAAGTPYEAQAVPMKTILLLQCAQAILLAGIINIIPSLGEEWGWRGYMMPRLMETMRPIPALLVGGVIWGLWHAPIVALGHNYGTGYPGWPWGGIGAMCVFCTALGILLTWLTEKTGSCIPAAVAHGALNGTAAVGLLVSADGGNPFIGPTPTGIVGGLPLLIAAVFAVRRLVKGPKAAEDPRRERT